MPLLLNLFLTFFKIGAFTFGGGYAMLPLFRAETLAEGWATEEEIINFIAVSESTPGPFAINMATYIGMEQDGSIEYGTDNIPLDADQLPTIKEERIAILRHAS